MTIDEVVFWRRVPLEAFDWPDEPQIDRIDKIQITSHNPCLAASLAADQAQAAHRCDLIVGRREVRQRRNVARGAVAKEGSHGELLFRRGPCQFAGRWFQFDAK